jgi:hypothetical protein
MHNRFRALTVVSALVVSFVAGGSAFGQNKKGAPPKVDKVYQAEIAAATKIVDDALKGQAAPSDYKFAITSHPMKGQGGKTFIPFIISFEKGQALPASLFYYLRVVSPENAAKAKKAIEEYDAAVLKATTDARLDPENSELADAEERARANMPRVEYAFEDVKNVTLAKPKADSIYRMPAAMLLAPGTYDAYLLAKEPVASLKNKKTPAKAGLLKLPLTVPDFASGDLTTSAIIVTNMMATLKAPPTPDQVAANPYIFGTTGVMPAFTDRFAKTDELTVFFFIYNTGADPTTGKPNVSVDYSFYTKTEGAEKFFNKTPSAELSAKTLPPNFDAKAGFVLPGTQTIPLESFPPGDYRLEIKIVDKVTGKTKTENVRFTVTP